MVPEAGAALQQLLLEPMRSESPSSPVSWGKGPELWWIRHQRSTAEEGWWGGCCRQSCQLPATLLGSSFATRGVLAGLVNLQSWVENRSMILVGYLYKSLGREHCWSGCPLQPLLSVWLLLHGSQEADLQFFFDDVLFSSALNETESGPGKLKVPFHFSFQLHMRIIFRLAGGSCKEQLENGETRE